MELNCGIVGQIIVRTDLMIDFGSDEIADIDSFIEIDVRHVY